MNLIGKIGISRRARGEVVDDKVTITEILSYDIADPSFLNAKIEEIDRHMRELERQELLRQRREKINRLNNL